MSKNNLKQDYEYADTIFARDIDSRVFQAIAFQCLTQIEGIELVGGNLLDNLFGRESYEKIKGIYVDQDQKTHSVNLKIELNISYGVSIPEKSEEIQQKIHKEICELTGLHVGSIHVIFKNLIAKKPVNLTEEIEKNEVLEFKETLHTEED